VNKAEHHDDSAHGTQPPGGQPPPGDAAVDPAPADADAAAGAAADTEQRPLGALAVTGFLTVTILVLWFGMYFLNLIRS